MTGQIDPALLEELYRRADASRWQLPRERLAQALVVSADKALAGAAPSARDRERYFSALRLEDLALACACAAGIDGAWEHFILEYRPILYRAAESIAPGGRGREMADSLYGELYGMRDGVGERGSLFRYYHGRSTLATWLRAVLAQRHVDRLRGERHTAPMPEHEPPAPERPPADPDRPRYRNLVERALAEAMDSLDARDRLRLRYYYAQQLTLAETGRLMREHEATVSRHLARTRRAIRRAVERHLGNQGVNADQIEQAFESVAEDAGTLDLDRMLAETAGDARNREPAVLSRKVKP